ncbi:MAG: ComEA family DNA-binding protein [Porticoccaceae bacterium]|jgi:competence protein ComEA
MKTIHSLLKSLVLFWAISLLAGWQAPAVAEEPSQNSGKAVAEQSATVNINSASAEEIASGLVGIGLVKAQAIVAWREANGSFTSKEQLLEIKGIGEATLEKNIQRIGL